MKSMLWILVSILISIGRAIVYVTNALRPETGRKRLLPLLRPLTHVINPRMVRAIERRESSYGVVHHSRTRIRPHVPGTSGRRTHARGRGYPAAIRAGDGLVPQCSCRVGGFWTWRRSGFGNAAFTGGVTRPFTWPDEHSVLVVSQRWR